MNLRFGFYSVAIACYVASQVALAHDLPVKLTYPGKSLRAAASFQLSEAELVSIYDSKAKYFDFERWSEEQLAKPSKPSKFKGSCFAISEAKTCGQIDDFYFAAMVGMHMCNSLSVIHRATYPDHLVPRFTGPESFVSGLEAAPNHHDNYSTSEGIAFDCVYPIEIVIDVIDDIEVIDREAVIEERERAR